MIKPTYLWALCKTCADSKWIGDVCRFLGGQDVKLDFGQRQVAEMIKMDSEWMDERINWNREAARMRQARARERRNAEHAADGKASREVTPVTRDKSPSREVTPPSRHPSVHPSVHPNINLKQKDINTDSDTEPEKGVQGDFGSEPGSESVDVSAGKIAKRAAAGRRNADPWAMTDDEVRYGATSAAAILRLAFGRGGWQKAVRQAGDEAVRELFLTFRSELGAGEVPNAPAAAFTERLKRDLGVDFGGAAKAGGAK